jgi:excisionase family DNA binding protein
MKQHCLTATKQARMMSRVDLVTVKEAAQEKGVSREAIYQAIQEGRLKTRKVLGKIGILRRSLDAYQPNHIKVQAGLIRARRRQQRSPRAERKQR